MSAMFMTENRMELSKMILIITGHNFWRRHNFLVDVEKWKRGAITKEELVPPFCDLCLTVMPDAFSTDCDEYLQTTQHLFSTCEALASARLRIFGKAFEVDLSTIEYRDIMNFIREANLDVLPRKEAEAEALDRSDLISDSDS